MQRVDEEVFCRVFPKEPVEHEKQKEKWNESEQVYKSLFRNVSYRLMPWDFFSIVEVMANVRTLLF